MTRDKLRGFAVDSRRIYSAFSRDLQSIVWLLVMPDEWAKLNKVDVLDSIRV